MTDEQKDAIEQLERRVATLENMVRRLTFVATGEQLRGTRAPAPAPAPPSPSSPQPPARLFPIATVADKARAGSEDLEQWFGQRGLLAVGVAALLIAAALFLKYAFDRGWIPPLVRSVGAVVAGIAVAAWGHERILKGMRRYGAAMIGAGGGLVYLGLWAAAGPYALMERRIGIVALAITTVAVTMLALHHEIEGLAIWALGGAYLAPLILATAPNPQGFLGYLEVIGLGTAITAYAMSWRATFNLAVFGYLFLAAAGAAEVLSEPLGLWLLAAGAVLTLHVTARRQWPEARLGVLLVAWGMVGSGIAGVAAPTATRWLCLAATVPVMGLIWWQHFQRDPFAAPATPSANELGDLAIERFLFIANPVVFIVFADAIGIPLLDRRQEIVPAALAVAYLPLGWVKRSAANLIMGFLLVALAMAIAWDAWIVTMGWTALALVALASEREATRPGGRNAAVTLITAAWVWLFSVALFDREWNGSTHVFTDRWAIALYAFLVGSAAAAYRWGEAGKRQLAAWTLSGSALFLGGSIQFPRYFGRVTALAGDLALSVWWLLFAGALVFVGFRLNQKVVRSTGLAVAGVTALKIVLYDLAQMRALYRVGSFFVLAIIALAVAYAYNNRAKASAA